MARTKRDKSASISSATAPTINGTMPPPSPPSSPGVRASPVTRRKAPSTSRVVASSSSLPAAKSAHAPAKPSITQFAVATVISLAAEAAGQSVASLVGNGELAGIFKTNVDYYQTVGYLAWKVTLLAICWFGGLDAVDVASLYTLLQTPIFVLLHYFYMISIPTLLTTCTISILTPALPFYLFRSLSAPHSNEMRKRVRLRNRIIIFDPVTTLAISALATVIFGITLLAAMSTFFPVFLVVNYDGLRDLTFAHNIGTMLPTLFVWLAPAGIATTQFLFRPAEGAAHESPSATGANSVALTHSHFDPKTASFVQHVYHNVWGWYTSRQKELIGRTIVLGTLLLTDVVLSTWNAIQGISLVGAAGYAGLWVSGAVILGIVLEWVGGPSD